MAKVTVFVPYRADYPGFWAGGRHFANGETVFEGTEEEIETLRVDGVGFLQVFTEAEMQEKKKGVVAPEAPAPVVAKPMKR